MIETIIVGITIVVGAALITAPAAFAYKDPYAYANRVSGWLISFVWLLFVPLFIWTGGVSFAYGRLNEFVDASRAGQALVALEFHNFLFRYLVIVPVVATLYFLILRNLKYLREYEDEARYQKSLIRLQRESQVKSISKNG